MSPAENDPTFKPLWTADLAAHSPPELNWLWHGYLLPGMTTLLVSQWKTGKTTLAAALLARMQHGGTFAGRALRPGKAVVISEETAQHWYERSRKLTFGPHLCWFLRPFRGRPSPARWLALQDTVLQLHAEHHFDLLVVDPFSRFYTGASENSSTAVIDFVTMLKPITEAGMALLVVHHPRKGRTIVGQAGRGNGALQGDVDINIEMYHFAHAGPTDRRRVLLTQSRFDDTPPRLVLELLPDGTDYLNHGDLEEDDFADSWKYLRSVFVENGRPMTRLEILEVWPPDLRKPNPATVWRWLDRAVGEDLLHRDGLGTRLHPYRYWLPEREHDPLFSHFMRQCRVQQEYHRLLSELGRGPDNDGDMDRAKRRALRQEALRCVYRDEAPPVETYWPDEAGSQGVTNGQASETLNAEAGADEPLTVADACAAVLPPEEPESPPSPAPVELPPSEPTPSAAPAVPRKPRLLPPWNSIE